MSNDERIKMLKEAIDSLNKGLDLVKHSDTLHMDDLFQDMFYVLKGRIEIFESCAEDITKEISKQ